MIADAISGPAYAGDDDRPLVAAHDTGNRPLWIGIGAILVFGLILFSILDARRQTAMAPAVSVRTNDMDIAPPHTPPPLYIPPVPVAELPAAVPTQATAPRPPFERPAIPVPPFVPAPATAPAHDMPSFDPILPVPVRRTDEAAGPIVFDQSAAEPVASTLTPGSSSVVPSAAVAVRARASRVQNRGTIVPQGTLIAAVLETALDSTQPGQARALVSSDVPNLYGNRVLVPRGSRLFGEYRGELQSGQNRALVQWTRLVRPDGVAIAIDSPASDRLGRAGIRGRVNSHFVQRLGGALLQSAIGVGTTIATQSLYDSPVLIAIPGATQSAASSFVGPAPRPTLKVRQGTRIAVFVVRDLDFTAVEGGR